MTNFVVYEDTPIAEYPKSNDGGETSVKPAPLHLGLHHSNMAPKASAISQLSEYLYRYWRQSLFHDTFSVSLPIMEESVFEEKFKYLIVTSPLLNDTLSTHPKQQHRRQKSTPPFHSAAAHTRSRRVGTVVTLSTLLAALGLERILPWQQRPQMETTSTLVLKGVRTPTITMTLASGVSLYFIYRHLRQSSIRKLYQCALTQLEELLDQSQLLDSKVHRALLTIQEIELVSHGYRLSTPLSQIEQSSKSKRCGRLRTELSGLLRHAFIVYEETIIDMTDRVNKPTLSRLFDMYNIHSIASLSAVSTAPATTPIPTKYTNEDSLDDDDDNSITVDYLKTLAQLMHLKRRECMLQFLALSVMTGNHGSMRKGYESGWRNVNTILTTLVNETKGFVKSVKGAMESEFCKSSTLDLDNNESSTLSTSTDTRHFTHHLSTLDQHLRTMEARVYLCHDELQSRHRILSSNRNNTDKDHPHLIELGEQQKSLRKEYMAMEKDIQQLVNEWETGRNALDTLLAPIPPPMIDTLTSTTEIIPSPLPSPTMTPTTASHADDDPHPFVVTSDESSDLFHLPLPSKAPVYDSACDVHDASPLNKKKIQSERMAEMKLKCEQAKEKSSWVDGQTMGHDLEPWNGS